MIPNFTAEAALPVAQAFYRSPSRAASTGTVILPQQDRITQPRGGDGALGLAPPSPCTCPCCQTHACATFGGLFGWDTCLTCC